MYKSNSNANQASTNRNDKHKDPLKYDGQMIRAHMKKFKDALGVFMKQKILLRMENQSASANGAQLSAFGGILDKGQKHHLCTLILYSVLQNKEFISNS